MSVKSSSEVLRDIKKALVRAKKRPAGETRYEISFDNRRDFERFIRSIPVLSAIIEHRPRSVYELAKRQNMDVSNLNKVILFLEEMGALRLKAGRLHGRSVKTPVVEYRKIEFKLVA